jgi:hypothetical protein
MGFVLEPGEAQLLIEKDPRNKDVLFPYLNGEDLNSRPDQSPSRWVINFFDWPLDRESAPMGYTGHVAAEYPDCLAIVETKVKPERMKNNRKERREKWWQYAEKAPALYRRIAGMERVIAISRITNYLAFAFLPSSYVFSDRLAILPNRARSQPPVCEPEWAMLSHPEPGRNSRDFQLRVVTPPAQYQHVISHVVLAERLREVRSLIGFTRIESPGDATDIEESPPDQRVPLSRARPSWVPTCDVRGEGIFLHMSEDAIQTWLKSKVVERLEQTFFGAHQRWRSIRGLAPQDGYPTMRYVLLHSLAHALLRQFSVECGYTTASIRERIYSRPPGDDAEPMAGILLYSGN